MIFSPAFKSAFGLAAIALIAVASLPAIGSAAAPAKPSFTADQASKGKTEFLANCSMCHGVNLQGISGPALKGKDADLQLKSAQEVYSYVTAEMPVGNAGGLPAAVYIDIMAYLLQSNGHHAGSAKLTAATLKASSAKIGGPH